MQEFLKCATWFELAHFGNSQFVVAHFRNSWFELAHFGISWIVVAHFRNSWFEAGPFKKLFSKLRFFGMFFTSMNQFLASNSHLFRWHVYSDVDVVFWNCWATSCSCSEKSWPLSHSSVCQSRQWLSFWLRPHLVSWQRSDTISPFSQAQRPSTGAVGSPSPAHTASSRRQSPRPAFPAGSCCAPGLRGRPRCAAGCHSNFAQKTKWLWMVQRELFLVISLLALDHHPHTQEQCPAGRVFQYWVGSGMRQNTGYRVGFGSVRSVKLYDRVFPGIFFIFGYFRV